MTTGREARDCACPLRHEHGTMAMYGRHGCRCFACRVRSAAQRRAVRARNTPGLERFTTAAGTARRLQALAVAGVPLPVIAAHLGTSPQAVHALRAKPLTAPVRVDVAARVREAYDALWDAAGPSTRTRTFALRRGWAPPLAWDDDTIDDPAAMPVENYTDYNVRKFTPARVGRPASIEGPVDPVAVAEAVAGRNVALTRAELTEAVATLDGMGYSATQIAERLRTTDRTVTRHRARRGEDNAA